MGALEDLEQHILELAQRVRALEITHRQTQTTTTTPLQPAAPVGHNWEWAVGQMYDGRAVKATTGPDTRVYAMIGGEIGYILGTGPAMGRMARIEYAYLLQHAPTREWELVDCPTGVWLDGAKPAKPQPPNDAARLFERISGQADIERFAVSRTTLHNAWIATVEFANGCGTTTDGPTIAQALSAALNSSDVR